MAALDALNPKTPSRTGLLCRDLGVSRHAAKLDATKTPDSNTHTTKNTTLKYNFAKM